MRPSAPRTHSPLPRTQDRLLAYSNGLRPISPRGVWPASSLLEETLRLSPPKGLPTPLYRPASDVRRHARLQG